MSAARLGASFDLLAAWQEGGVFLDADGVGIATGPGESVAPVDVLDALRDRPEGGRGGRVALRRRREARDR
jgi:hypothetical protein